MNDFYYKNLDAYKLSKELAIMTYRLLKKYPADEKFALCDQLRRAVISVPSNIAEGSGRFSLKERTHFMDIAYGSLCEKMCQIEISQELGYITMEDFHAFEQLASRVSMTIVGLKQSYEKKINNIINQQDS